MRKALFLIALIVSISAYFSAADTVTVFESREKGKKSSVRTTLTKTEAGYEERTEKEVINSSLDFLTEKSTFQETKKNNRFTAEKAGKEIRVTGTLNGKEVKKTLVLNNKVWIQSFTMAMMYFMANKLDTLTFNIIRQDIFEMIEFEIKRKDVETINVQGTAVQTQKLHLNPAGMGSLFWGMDSWLRLTDFIPVYSKMSDGTEVSLVSQD